MMNPDPSCTLPQDFTHKLHLPRPAQDTQGKRGNADYNSLCSRSGEGFIEKKYTQFILTGSICFIYP